MTNPDSDQKNTLSNNQNLNLFAIEAHYAVQFIGAEHNWLKEVIDYRIRDDREGLIQRCESLAKRLIHQSQGGSLSVARKTKVISDEDIEREIMENVRLKLHGQFTANQLYDVQFFRQHNYDLDASVKHIATRLNDLLIQYNVESLKSNIALELEKSEQEAVVKKKP